MTIGRNWSEPWYALYGLLAIASVGITPILLPQFVSSEGASAVGLVLGAFNLGGLTAPIWGRMAEHRLHKPLMLGGLSAVMIGLALLPASRGTVAWSGLALLQGAGIAAVSTVAGLLVVERHPRAEWDQRMGWLLTFYGIGQVAGLLLASLFSGPRSGTGLLVAAALVLVAIPVGAVFVQTPIAPAGPIPRARPQPTRVPHVPASAASVHHHFGEVSRAEFFAAIRSPFGLLIAATTITLLGAALVFTAYPLLFATVYRVTPARSSLAFGISAALAIVWYPLAGFMAHRHSAIAVQVLSLSARCAGLAFLLAMTLTALPMAGWWAEIGFLVIVNSWPFISVSGTVLAASLAPTYEGTAMGIYNGFSAIGNTAGAFLTGVIAHAFGYRALTWFAMGILLPGTLLLLPLWRHSRMVNRNSIGAIHG